MSVLIKGMKMPEKCGSCDLFHVESPMHCTVVKGHKTVGAPYGMPRPDWCPLVEIPEHGRLIDADALIEFCAERWIPLNIDAVNMQPTIQPEKAQLSQEGATSDLISRQAARHALCKAVHNGEDVPCENQTASCLWTGTRVCDFVREIDALPTIQPEPHEGRFERKRDGVFCSVCHYGWEFITGVPAEVEREYHYCPNCGADMRGEKDG